MSKVNEEIYHIFDANGEIKQIEYALSAVNNSNPIVTVSSDEHVVCVSRKYNKEPLQEDVISTVKKVSDNLYLQMTGRLDDMNFIFRRIVKLASDKEYELGCKLTPDIFARVVGDKMQKYIQRSSYRIPAFASTIFGMQDGKTVVYFTDLSAVEYQCFANASGKDYLKMNNYLENNYSENKSKEELINLALGALLMSIGRTAEFTEIDAFVFSKEGLIKLEDQEINRHLQIVAEEF
ncbi:PSA [Hepatospora eriocheir]|uniref:PSA n=1 Tax=Hepatospora eriocheir TaxID=1081669 RepID=A0A1X0QLB3_9MICR|nr:PSA [Hepatospora eriocheir]